MTDTDAEGESRTGDANAADLAAIQARLSEVQQRKRKTVRWHMSRDTAERAIAAITTGRPLLAGGRGKSRRRKRHKRLL